MDNRKDTEQKLVIDKDDGFEVILEKTKYFLNGKKGTVAGKKWAAEKAKHGLEDLTDAAVPGREKLLDRAKTTELVKGKKEDAVGNLIKAIDDFQINATVDRSKDMEKALKALRLDISAINRADLKAEGVKGAFTNTSQSAYDMILKTIDERLAALVNLQKLADLSEKSPLIRAITEMQGKLDRADAQAKGPYVRGKTEGYQNEVKEYTAKVETLKGIKVALENADIKKPAVVQNLAEAVGALVDNNMYLRGKETEFFKGVANTYTTGIRAALSDVAKHSSVVYSQSFGFINAAEEKRDAPPSPKHSPKS